MKTVELKDLIGLHTLSAVETGYAKEGDSEGCGYLAFILDGRKYTAFEDLDDGYRSFMDRIVVGRGKLKNTVPDTTVVAVPARERHSTIDSLLVFYAVDNGEIVMEVGTDYYDEYYPSFVANFYPQNLPANKSEKAEL
jgi:hypothetical protein